MHPAAERLEDLGRASMGAIEAPSEQTHAGPRRHRLPEAARLATFARIGARLPVGRIGKPEDIAEAYLYLMNTGFSTGETIVVDGGVLQAS